MTHIHKYISAIIMITGGVFTSCDDFLSEVPDNRTEINTEANVKALITSAYPTASAMFMGEYSSDNVDDYGPNNPYTYLFIEQIAYWKDMTEESTDYCA